MKMYRKWRLIPHNLSSVLALPPRKAPPVLIGYEAERTPETVWMQWQREISLPVLRSQISVMQAIYELPY
jgi:hypothetical protein